MAAEDWRISQVKVYPNRQRRRRHHQPCRTYKEKTATIDLVQQSLRIRPSDKTRLAATALQQVIANDQRYDDRGDA